MKKITTKITAVLLAVLMLMPFFAPASFAALNDGGERSLRIETAIYKQINGEWTRTTRVAPGDAVRGRIFVNTDYFSNAAELTVFYDSDFFEDSYPVSVGNVIATNTSNPVVTSHSINNSSSTFSKSGITPIERLQLVKNKVLPASYYDAHNYFAMSIVPSGSNFVYNSDEWMFEFNLTVRSDATGTGNFFVEPKTICNSQQSVSVGINFPKGDEGRYDGIGMWLWNNNFGYEPKVEIVSNPVGVAGAAMNVEITAPAGSNEILVGGTKSLSATVTPEDTVNKLVNWSSSNPDVATVDGGMITGVGPGTATITATTADGGFTDTYDITVIQRVTGINIYSKATITGKGNKATLPATVQPLNASNQNVSWSSDTLSVVTVEESYNELTGKPEGILTAVSAGTAIVTATTEDGSFNAKCTVTVKVLATGISLDNNSLSVLTGETKTLNATVAPDDATDKNVIWSSDNNNIATVVDGAVTGVSKGTATITARSEDGNFTDTCFVTVTKPATGIDVTPETASVIIGGSVNLAAAVTPGDASNLNYSWSSSDESVATVVNGVVTGVSKGVATITATSEDGSFTDTCLVTVTKPATDINVTPETASVRVNGTVELSAGVLPSDASNQNVIWRSGDNSIATVVNGVVTGVNKGVVTITAESEDGSFTDTCLVTVTQPVTGIDVTPFNATVNVGSTAALTAAVTPANASNTEFSWSSSNSAVASVDGNGVVTGVAKGVAVITAKTQDGSFTDSCLVTVVKPVSSIEFQNTGDVILGESGSILIPVIITPVDASNLNLIWSSSDESVATVENGYVTAVGSGTATITVRTEDGGFTDSCIVIVPRPMSSITLSQTEATMKYKKTSLRLTATPVPGDASDSEITWSSSNTSIVRVDENGNVTARDMGTAYIIASNSDGTVTSQCRVTVTMTFFQKIVRFFKILFGVWNVD